MSDFKIDPKVRDYMPQPDKACNDELEKSIIADGCRDPLLIARLGKDLILMDGHRRYAICKKHDIAFKTVTWDVDSRDEIFALMRDIQLTRRNLPPNQMARIRGRLKAEPGKVSKEVEEVAKKSGSSTRTVYRSKEYTEAIEKLAPSIKDTVEKEWSQKDAVKLAKLPEEEQVKQVKERAKTRKTPERKFDRASWTKQWDRQIGPLVRLVDKIASSVGEKNCKHHDDVLERLEQATQVLKKWMGK